MLDTYEFSKNLELLLLLLRIYERLFYVEGKKSSKQGAEKNKKGA